MGVLYKVVLDKMLKGKKEINKEHTSDSNLTCASFCRVINIYFHILC